MHELLIVHQGDDWIRGSETCLLSLATGLDPARFRPTVVCTQPGLARALSEAGVEHHRVPVPELPLGPGAAGRLPRYLRGLAAVERIARSRPFALIYSNAGVSGQIGGPLARRLGLPELVHVHGPITRRYYYGWLLPWAAELVFVSDAVRRGALARVRFRGRVATLPNGIDLERFRPAPARDPRVRAELGARPGEVVYAQVGSLIPRKGVDVLLRAFAQVVQRRPARLLLLGEGPERPALERLAGDLGVRDRVRFCGEVAQPERVLAHAVDVHVLASRSEAWGLAVAEAAACGVPSVASDREGLPEVVRPGATGFLVPAEDPAALAERLDALGADPVLRARLGAAARADAETRFSRARWLAALEAEIEALVAGPRTAA